MRRLVAILLVVSASARPAGADSDEPSLKGTAMRRAALALCREGLESLNGGHAGDGLRTADAVASVKALIDVLASPGGCHDDTRTSLADLVCREQMNLDPGVALTPALRPLRATLDSSDGRRVRVGLAALRTLTARQCPAAEPLLRASLSSLKRLARRTTGSTRREAEALLDEVRRPIRRVVQHSSEPHQGEPCVFDCPRSPSPQTTPPTVDHGLPRSALVSGMNAVKPKIADCYVRLRQSGMAMVNLVIAPDGSVTSATVTGKFAETATGACVEAAVKAAVFPSSDEGLTTPYPFQLK